MAFVEPIALAARGIELVPLSLDHEIGLRDAAADGELWKLRITSVPEPEHTRSYIETALAMREAGNRFAFAVTHAATRRVLGCTSFHDIVPAIRRLEIGWTWYAKSCQRTHVNTTAKLLMMTHAFETLGCEVVGWRTDNFNFASQTAIERLGAKLDGILRSHQINPHPLGAGELRDTCVYSIIANEWPNVRAHLDFQLNRSAPKDTRSC